MKYIILILMFFSITTFASAYGGNGRGGMQRNNNQNKQNNSGDCIELDNIKDGEKYEITTEEIEAISHMREEEKIARDVYIKLYEKWGIRSFDNIKNSEQKHMDAIKVLIDKYDLKDSMKSNEVGVFNAPEFQKLYNDLIAKGMKSEIDALQVGMTIEDVDIYDLEKYLAETNNEDIKTVFNNLNQGSMNHARAFQRQLDRRAGEYKAQYISSERLDEILAGSNGKNNQGHKNINHNDGCHGNGECMGERINSEKINYQKKDFNNLNNKTRSDSDGFFSRIFSYLKFWNWF